MRIVVHMIVYNEESWIKYAILSVINLVSEMLIFDTGSTDKTIDVIRSFSSSKIRFFEKGRADARKMVRLRNEQINLTKTSWFMLLDGDEIWPENTMKKCLNFISNSNLYGIYLRNHLCVGDVYHRMPESYGRYELCGRRGHLNMRFFRKTQGWKWWGEYPLEYYCNAGGDSINTMCEHLAFIDDYYWHMSFMLRSAQREKNRIKYHLGEKIKTKLPEVFGDGALRQRSFAYLARSLVETPIRWIKNIST